MKKLNRLILACHILLCVQAIHADNNNLQDTIRTYHMDEVVVTSSTKETNDFRTLPGSVSVISPQAVNNRQIDALKDISSFVPNLYIPDYGAKLTSAIYIRGIGARSSGQSIGLYVDNVPYLDKSTFDFELTDIQRIEVLRGPQGTLYGRNAMGGIVNIYTLSPFDYQGTKLSVSAGNYGQVKTKASHYMTIGDNIGLSFSGYYDRSDGYFKNVYTGKKADHEESAGGRFKFDWLIKPNLSAAYTFSYDYVNQGAFPYGLYHKETGVIDPVNINDSSHYDRNVLTSNLLLEYKTSKFMLTSTTGHQYFKDDMLMDQDFTAESVFTLNQRQKQHAFSEEIAIKSVAGNNYQWSFGLYGFYNNLKVDGPVMFKKDGIKNLQEVFENLKQGNPSMPLLSISDEQLYIPGSFKTPSYGVALFHQSTYNNLFTDGLSVTAGARLDYEKQEMDYKSAAKMNLKASQFMGMPPGMPPVEIPTDTTFVDVNVSQDFWQFLPKVSLKYECTPSTFAYISAAKGYKTGGYNVQMSADLMQGQMQYEIMNKYAPAIAGEYKPEDIKKIAAYKPEKSWNYELGIRSELIENRLNTEFTFFYMDIKDMQLTQFVKSGNGRILTNAGKARSLGVEASFRLRITRELTADANYGFTHATFRDYICEEKREGEVIQTDCKGNFIPYTPRHTLNIGLHYNKLFRHAWIDQFTASAQFSGAGKIYWTEQNDIKQNFYGLLNAKAGIRKGIVKLDLWSRNITDTQYAAFYFESFGNPFIQKGKPFQIGAELSIAF